MADGMEKDSRLLIEAMTDLGNGNFEYIDETRFDNAELAQAFNGLIDKITDKNNHYLARINDAQSRIGDTSCVKNMFEEITAEQDVLKLFQNINTGDALDRRALSEINDEFLTMAEQIRSGYEPCARAVDASMDKVERLLNSEEVKASEALKEAFEGLKAEVDLSKSRLNGLSRRTVTLSEDARELYDVIDSKLKLNRSLLGGVDILTESYKKLAADCLDTGRHLYRISRDIDNTRNDMFRHNSKPSLHDRLRVYEVDHITLAWRLYNNIVEFESLRVTQVNNPQSCKFGIWLNNMTDPFFVNCESFQKAKSAHEAFHAVCLECFEAKQAYDTRLAMEKFDAVLEKLEDLKAAMEELHDYLRDNGIIEETDVWKFRT